MKVLGIETSCDETAVAIYDGQLGLLAHQIYSQIDLHAQYGGVVPELASRDHVRKIIPLIHQTLDEAKLKSSDIDGIAYTRGPGLVGALMVGASVAKSLGWAWNIPTLGVHHLEAHMMAVFLEEQVPEFPFVSLIVSGGHTFLAYVEAVGRYQLLGDTLDDAAGEAFDKTAKLLGLPYPGGPELSALALQGDPERFIFPRPMVNRPGMDFSFSGLKTHAVSVFKQHGEELTAKADIACAFEIAVVDTLLIKCRRALKHTDAKQLVVAGGVSANQRLREELSCSLLADDVAVYFPRHEYCTDNGAMVAYTGYLRLARGEREAGPILPIARWPLDQLS